MQRTPILQAIRYVFLALGFTLFVLVAVRSAQTINDPRATKGVPNIFSLPGGVAFLPSTSVSAAAAPTRANEVVEAATTPTAGSAEVLHPSATVPVSTQATVKSPLKNESESRSEVEAKDINNVSVDVIQTVSNQGKKQDN